MKFVQLALNYAPSVGGLQSHLEQVCTRLVANHGVEVEVWTTDALVNPAGAPQGQIPCRSEIIDGVLVRRFPYVTAHRKVTRIPAVAMARWGLPGRELVGLLRRGPWMPHLLRELLRTDADVVGASPFDYVHTYYPQVARRVARRGFGVVLLGALHLGEDPIPRRIVRAVRGADAYVAFTSFERDELVRAGAPGARLCVIPPGVDRGPYDAADPSRARAMLGLGDRPVVAFIGRQAAYKGIDVLIQAMAGIWDDLPSAELVIAGARTQYSDDLRRQAAALPVAARRRVHFVDGIDEQDKADLYAATDVFVSTSDQESFGMVYLEAWAAGTVVIGADIPVTRSVVGDDGVLVPVRDQAALGAAIRHLLQDSGLRADLARRGRKRLELEYDWDSVAARWHAVVSKAASRSVAGREGRR